jgi:hypothetical protein
MELRKLLKNAVIDAFEPKQNYVNEVIKIGYSLNYWDNFNINLYNQIRKAHGKAPLQ